MEEPHMKKLTYTHRALTFVMDEILENPDAGASPDATKVLVLITDGDPSDVKYAAMDKYQAIVSEPPQKYAFKIENYYRLTLSDEISQSGLRDIFYKFAAVQFSTEHRKVFDFKDYEAGRAHENLMEEPHMKKLTNTHAALTFVMDEILENPDAGASPDATKVLVLITDGDPSDVDRNNIIKRYDDKNIIRFVIGVKLATLDKFRAIASEPSEKYAFKIQHYNGLTDILENFQKKIFNME
ncbi:hypothetical protein INR49_031162, partial [Caranx melampygus]